MSRIHRLALPAGLAAMIFVPSTAPALTITGNVSFQGAVAFDAPIAGIAAENLTVRNGLAAEATGNGEQCEVLSVGSAPVGSDALWPASGSLVASIAISRGGNSNVPEGTCLLQLRASGNDGGDVSASGALTVEVSAAEIDADATIAAGTIEVRQSKTQAGVDALCLKWVKKQLKLRSKCNASLWSFGADGIDKCKDAGEEPLGCDPAGYVEDILELAFAELDQQDGAPLVPLSVDRSALSDQVGCQRLIGKGAVGFVTKRMKAVQTSCVAAVADGEDCRLAASADSAARLGAIDSCIPTQLVDPGSLLDVPQVGSPCADSCFDAGAIDRKCLKSCFEAELSTLSDGILGDVPECANGVVQAGETCDDGNLADGDCCSAACQLEPSCP